MGLVGLALFYLSLSLLVGVNLNTMVLSAGEILRTGFLGPYMLSLSHLDRRRGQPLSNVDVLRSD